MSVESPSWNKPERMTHVELVTEVFRLREELREKEERARAAERLRERVAALEQRDRERAAHLKKANNLNMTLLKRVDRERALREEADRNSARWHALLLREKVRNLPKRDTQAAFYGEDTQATKGTGPSE